MTSQKPVVGSSDSAVNVRGRKMAASLSSLARQLSFENTTRRNLYRIAGLAPKIHDRFFAILVVLSFLFCLILPFTIGVVYFAVGQSEIYQSSVRFVLRSATPILTRDRFGDSSFEPKGKIVQDTQIVVNYLNSQDFLEKLQKEHDLQKLYGNNAIDWLSRLREDNSREDLLKYWDGKTEASIHTKSGIVTLAISAFAPEQARALLVSAIALLETRINSLNASIWHNLKAGAEKEVQSASEQLANARTEFEQLQTQSGVYDIDLAAKGLTGLLADLEKDLARLRAERTTLSDRLSEGTTSIRFFDQRIRALEQEIRATRTQIVGGSADPQSTLSQSSSRFEKAKLKIELAEDRFANAVRHFERVQLVSSLQLVYLEQLDEPTLPQDHAGYSLALKILLLLLACLIAWGVVGGSIVLLRNKID